MSITLFIQIKPCLDPVLYIGYLFEKQPFEQNSFYCGPKYT